MTINELLTMSDAELFISLESRLMDYFPKVEAKGDMYLYAPGSGTHCLVAHIDTVRKEKTPPILIQERNIIYSAKGVLGADDRAGIYVILQIIDQCSRCGVDLPHVLFTNYEESGGKGASQFCSDMDDLNGVNLFIEYDRKGASEYVTYNDFPREVHRYVESFGYTENHGSFSDISILCEHFLIPGANLSCGYYGAHSDAEEVHLDELDLAISRGFGMAVDPITQLYPIEQYKSLFDRGWGGHMGSYNDWARYYDYGTKKKNKGKKKKNEEVILTALKQEPVSKSAVPDEVVIMIGDEEVEMSEDLYFVLIDMTDNTFVCSECNQDVIACTTYGCGTVLAELEYHYSYDLCEEFMNICEEETEDELYGTAKR